MARQDNPFALLGEDEDGGDVSVLLAKVEAKISSTPAPAHPSEQPKAKTKSSPPAGNGFPSKPVPPSEYVRAERGRGRGGRGRGSGRVGHGSTGDDRTAVGDDSSRQFGSRYPRDFGGDSEGRGRGGGRGGRGRGRGRGFYEDRGSNQENQFDVGKEIREQNGVEDKVEVHGKHGNGDRRSNWEERGNAGENRRFRGSGEGREGRGAFGGGRGSRGGDGRRYIRRDGAGDGGSGGSNGPQEKDGAEDGKEQADGSSVTVADGATGWDAPETIEVPKVADPDQLDAKQVSGEASGENAEEKDNEMTLEEYEKVLQEKRKALESLRTEERKVIVDKDFQSMQLIEKKEVDNYVKLKLEKDKLKKKDSFEKEEKVRKSVSINEFLKPAEGEKYTSPMPGRGRTGGRGRGRGERGGYMGHSGRPDPVFQLQDNQFPELGAAMKA